MHQAKFCPTLFFLTSADVFEVDVVTSDENVVNLNDASGPNPSLQDWPGIRNFRIRINESERSRDPQVSQSLIGKL
jgi:hypothetical protein